MFSYVCSLSYSTSREPQFSTGSTDKVHRTSAKQRIKSHVMRYRQRSTIDGDTATKVPNLPNPEIEEECRNATATASAAPRQRQLDARLKH